MKTTIVLKNIKKSFTNGENVVHVLKDISFTAYEKELIILMGPSGSGKTTLISIIGGILTPDSGECLVLDKPINSLPVNEKTSFRGKHVGFMFQHFMLIPTLNAVENASIPLLCLGNEREASFKKAAAFLEQLDMKNLLYKYTDNLSGGEQQRVAIARACLHDPKVILCDEPTSFLDLERGKKVMEILQAIRDTNECTVIVITHDPRILEFADRVIRIEDGVLVNNNEQSAHEKDVA